MDRRNPLHRIWLAPLLAAVLACASFPAPDSPPDRARPTLWRALRGDGSAAFYLLGSVHMGRESSLRLPERVEEAYARSDELVLEIDFTALVGQNAVRAAQRYAFIQPPASLRDRVSPGTLDALAGYLESRGEPLAVYLQLQPWFLATQLGVQEAQRVGLDPQYGVDRYFAQRAAGSKRIVGLESAESQMALFAGLPADVQELMLVDLLRRPEELGKEAEALLGAWERGDDAELGRIAFRPLRESPELDVFYERIMFGRNESMTQRLAQLARDGRLRFVVVGAAHLLGRRGIPALLRDYGFRLEKVN